MERLELFCIESKPLNKNLNYLGKLAWDWDCLAKKVNLAKRFKKRWKAISRND